MSTSQYTIGVLGGMGTYATIHLFRQYAAVFPAEKEWDRPRIIIDNRCNMPSRVRAALYGENREQLIDEMSESIGQLMESGCDRILLGCNTAHLFLSDIYRMVPGSEERIVNVIETCADEINSDGVSEVFLLASEGTIDSGVYRRACSSRGILCRVPAKEEYTLLRECIEAVKRNRYTDEIRNIFTALIRRSSTCIMGCTELPVLCERYHEACADIRVYDPVYLTLCKLHREYLEENR